MNSITLNTFAERKQRDAPFVCLTAYDAGFARLLSECGVELLLIGDSLGNVVQGHDTTLPVELDDMVYHTACVARGNRGAWLLADMPFAAAGGVDETLRNAARLMRAGAQGVKLEGGAWLTPHVELLTRCGIPVCAHLGLCPQSINFYGQYGMRAKDKKAQKRLREDALALQDAGASLLVLECVPEAFAAELSDELDIPTIGIGSGVGTDAQILVLYDMLGINPNPPSFCPDYMASGGDLRAAVQRYCEQVRQRQPLAG